MSKGALIALVGMDFAGKTTVRSRLENDFPNAVFVREPGGTVMAEKIRADFLKADSFKDMSPAAQLNLFYACREDLVARIIAPALRAGKDVIADRFDACTFAYQVVAERAKHLKDLVLAQRDACLGNREIDPVYLFFDLEPALAIERSQKSGREQDHRDAKGLEYYARVRHGYEEFFRETQADCSVIDASQDEETVYQNVLAEIRGVHPASDLFVRL